MRRASASSIENEIWGRKSTTAAFSVGNCTQAGRTASAGIAAASRTSARRFFAILLTSLDQNNELLGIASLQRTGDQGGHRTLGRFGVAEVGVDPDLGARLPWKGDLEAGLRRLDLLPLRLHDEGHAGPHALRLATRDEDAPPVHREDVGL